MSYYADVRWAEHRVLTVCVPPHAASGPRGTLAVSSEDVEQSYNDWYDEEWGSFWSDMDIMAAGPPPDWVPSGDRKDRERVIEQTLDANPEELNLALVHDYFAEVRYQNSKNIVVPRPSNGSNDAEAQRAYENMRIRLRNTKYNTVRPGPANYYIPSGATVLSETVKQLNDAGTPWLIRGGGHSYEATTLPTGDGWAVIDMAKFTSMRVSKTELRGEDGVAYREFSFGTGLRLGTMYTYLAKKALALVSGTCPTNGSGGYFLGGGAGPSMRKLGWGSDQLIRAKVILSDGTFAVADADDSKALPGQTIAPTALLYALRGGGSGTAVVYEYTLRVYPVPNNISRCRIAFSTSTKDAYQMFVRSWSEDWKIWGIDGGKFPFIRIYSTNNESAIVMDAWETTAEDLSRTLTEGMATAGSIQKGAPRCQEYDWDSFLFETFASYYTLHPEMAASLTWNNFTTPWLLAMDYIGWGYAGASIPVAPPLSPFADFDAVSPTVNGPSAFTAQGILSSKPWTAETAGSLWDQAIGGGSRFYSYALGGALDDEKRGAAKDDDVGA